MVEPGDELTVAADVTLPAAEVLTGRGFVTGKSGSGKSNTASVLAEELLELDARLLVVDTDGEYYGLKEEYELLHVGADDRCDVVVGPGDAPTIAELVVADAVPVVVDVSGFLEAETADRLVYEVAKHVFSRAGEVRQPCLLLVEEVHEFVPEQGGLGDVGEMLVRIAKRGRKRGLGLGGLSQRPAAVDKDFITQCDWMAWHRLTWANDTRVVKRVLGDEYAEDIEYLETGEAFLQTDWDGEIRRVEFRRKRTHDAGATPGFGETADPDLLAVPDEWLAAFDGSASPPEREPAPDAPGEDGGTPESGGAEEGADASDGDASETPSEETADESAGGTRTPSPPNGGSTDAGHVTWELGQLVFYVTREAGRRTGGGLRAFGLWTRGAVARAFASARRSWRAARSDGGTADPLEPRREEDAVAARPLADLLVGVALVLLFGLVVVLALTA